MEIIINLDSQDWGEKVIATKVKDYDVINQNSININGAVLKFENNILSTEEK